jgi:DNA invertase Pin-like site-specific DNA recombinase
MTGRKFGYSRVSTSDQDWSLQLEALTRAGVDDRDIYREKASGAKRDQTELRRMIDQLRPGDQADADWPLRLRPWRGGLQMLS